MRNFKKLPRKQLEKFSPIFTQLGLVLVLFVVFVSLEYKTEKSTASIDNNNEIDNANVYVVQEDKVIIYEALKPKPVSKPKSPVIENLQEVDKVKDDFVETIIHNTDEETIDMEIVDPDDIIEVIIPEEPDPEPLSILRVQKAPVFAGCEGLSEQENRKCLDNKMKKLVQKHFNASLANELELKSGRHRIVTQFVIDTKGYITDVKIMAPHPKLKKETSRIIKKIPKFTPAMQQDKNVKVKYTLPILFRVD